VTKCLRSGDLTSKPCTKLLGTVQGLNELKEKCLKKKASKTVVCQALNQVPGLPDLPGIGDGLGQIPLVGDLLGLGRPASGPTQAASSSRGPTMGQLSRAFDPALVQLLVPGMVTQR
jgi:phospholipid/cholesterol/gamma-HCH transport system substrate-binding protein